MRNIFVSVAISIFYLIAIAIILYALNLRYVPQLQF
jgi:hypothetical protein